MRSISGVRAAALILLALPSAASAALMSRSECRIELRLGQWAALEEPAGCEVGVHDGVSPYAKASSFGRFSIEGNGVEAVAAGLVFVAGGFSDQGLLGSRARSRVSATADLYTRGPVRDGWLELSVFGSGSEGFDGSLLAFFTLGEERGDWEETRGFLACGGACGGRLPIRLGRAFPLNLSAELNHQARDAADTGAFGLAVRATFWESTPEGLPGAPVSVEQVPEPSGVISSATGLAILAWLRRRARARRAR